MRILLTLTLLAAAGAHHAPAKQPPAAAPNVNSRYTVLNVDWKPQKNLSRRLREDLSRLVGQKLDFSLLDTLRERIKRETGAVLVRQKLVKGDKPDTVRVVFEIQHRRGRLDANLPLLSYHSSQGISILSGIDASFNGNTVGYLTGVDRDTNPERSALFSFHYARPEFLHPRLSLRFDTGLAFATWDGRSREALTANLAPEAAGGLYSRRTFFLPTLTFRLSDRLTWTSGVNFQNVTDRSWPGGPPAANVRGAHAVVQNLRLRQQWAGSGFKQSLDAGYALRAATSLLGSDFLYSRHAWDASYRIQGYSHQLRLRLAAGTLGGSAPVFERFVLGNSEVLRGWNKWKLTPLGVRSLAAGSTEYLYRGWLAFHDWGRGAGLRGTKQSAGFGYVTKGGFFLALAFPLRAENTVPVFLAGFNF